MDARCLGNYRHAGGVIWSHLSAAPRRNSSFWATESACEVGGENGGLVVWVQHNGPAGDVLEPETEGWQILPMLGRRTEDETVSKTACDAFLGTRLETVLRNRGCDRVIITGWATDFCVDTTVRSCTARGFKTWVAADGHTLTDRPHLPATKVIEHHNYVWSDLIAPGGAVTVATCEELMAGSAR
jgi:nicotinamidase-related amidase